MDFFLVFGGCTLFRLPDEHKKLPNARIFAQESTAVVNIRAPILVGQDEVKLVITPGKYEIYPASSNSFVQDVFTFVSEIDTPPLIAARILRFLEAVWEWNTASDSQYAPTESAVEYL